MEKGKEGEMEKKWKGKRSGKGREVEKREKRQGDKNLKWCLSKIERRENINMKKEEYYYWTDKIIMSKCQIIRQWKFNLWGMKKERKIQI